MAKRKKKEPGCLASVFYSIVGIVLIYIVVGILENSWKEILILLLIAYGIWVVCALLWLWIKDRWQRRNGYSWEKIDRMSGSEFENACANILRWRGYQNVRRVGGSGDQGVDIIADFGGLTYAVQCKRYSSNLGNTPIQEVVAGKAYHHCDAAMVITNVYFTQGAIDLAVANGVTLIDRRRLASWLTAPPKKGGQIQDSQVENENIGFPPSDMDAPKLDWPEETDGSPADPEPCADPANQVDPGLRFADEARYWMKQCEGTSDPVEFVKFWKSAQNAFDQCRKNTKDPKLQDYSDRFYVTNENHLDEDLVNCMVSTEEAALPKITPKTPQLLRNGAYNRIVAQLEAVQPYCGDIAEPVRQRILAEVQLAMGNCENVSNLDTKEREE